MDAFVVVMAIIVINAIAWQLIKNGKI